MFNTFFNIISSIPSTIVGGVFLLSSIILSKLDIHFLIDPAWVTVFLSGLPLVRLAIRRIIKNKGISKISSALLISIAMIAAILIGDIFAAGEVAFIMAIGEILEDLTTDRAKKGLKKLISIAPTTGRLIINGKEEQVSAIDIKKGDIIRILPGESIPADGIIVSGNTSVDQSVMTGESLPVDKTVNDTVFCGTLNRFGSIDIKVTNSGNNSSLQKLIKMVKDAENKKAPIARIADKAASWLVPAALLVAVITGIVTKDIVRAVTILVVFCPCALVLATPTAIMASIGQATKHGVIIKSGEVIEKMAKADTIAFDKTGTLTHGNLTVSDICPYNTEKDMLIKLASCAEAKSEHPLAKAIVEYAKANDIGTEESEHFTMVPGKGVTAKIDSKTVLCGNIQHLTDNAVAIDDANTKIINDLKNQGKATVLVALNGAYIGVIALSDTIRSNAKETLNKLNANKIQTVLVTGDSNASAQFFKAKTGISNVYSELLPDKKVEIIEKLKASGKIVCMVGDGVNDAPALKTADIGVAMGTMGSDIAVDAADIALMNDDISKLPYLKKLAVETVKTIKFSIGLSMIINILAVILSAKGILTPTTGALVHNAGSCFVVLISALLYDRKI